MDFEEKKRQIMFELPLYNTAEDPMPLKGYGRNVQNMVRYCMKIEDKDERTRCAYQIVKVMKELRETAENDETKKYIFWDHLYAMSGNTLDIDYPDGYQPVPLTEFKRPERLEYEKRTKSSYQFRHYGTICQSMLQKACEMEEGPEKDELVTEVANQMKRNYINFNKDSVTDNKIFDDISELTNGQIDLRGKGLALIDNDTVLHQNVVIDKNKTKKKKKKKKRNIY